MATHVRAKGSVHASLFSSKTVIFAERREQPLWEKGFPNSTFPHPVGLASPFASAASRRRTFSGRLL
jgi:hypothetical protein